MPNSSCALVRAAQRSSNSAAQSVGGSGGALAKSMAAKRARREGETRDREVCDTCDFFGCTCGVATEGLRGGARRKRYILDHLAALSADLVKATDELWVAVDASPCVGCTRPKDLCCCDLDSSGPDTDDTEMVERLQGLAGAFEDALNGDRHLAKSSSDEQSSSDDESSSSDDETDEA